MNTDDYEFSNHRYHAFVSVAAEILDGYVAALETLDDRTVNKTPLSGTVNTAFALVTHVHGMVHYWGGAFVAGEDIPRDRDAEFRASGTVAEAHVLIEEVRGRLPDWARIALTEGIRNREATGTSRRDIAEVTPEWVLEHILHELAQHLGHLEVCRDVVGVDA
ncbi:DUF664 domain-containing protein [Corynebacterium glyciniphilum]|uniref:mycothiol transferase n=1 Tax=Corynebacterium glyciniphilum TaxID=1404244 RepID=UPI003DA0CA29